MEKSNDGRITTKEAGRKACDPGWATLEIKDRHFIAHNNNNNDNENIVISQQESLLHYYDLRGYIL